MSIEELVHVNGDYILSDSEDSGCISTNDLSDLAPEISTQTRIVKRKRRKPTPSSILEEVDELLNMMSQRIDDTKSKAPRYVRSHRRKLQHIRNMVSRLAPKRRKNAQNPNSHMCRITNQLCDFLRIPRGSVISRGDMMAGVYVYIKWKRTESRPRMVKWRHLNHDESRGIPKRNLTDPSDSRYIIPDKKLKLLINYKKYCSDVSNGVVKGRKRMGDTVVEVVEHDTRLTYGKLQSLINKHVIELVSSEED